VTVTTLHGPRRNHDRSIMRAGQQIVEAVLNDRYAVGISGAGFAGQEVIVKDESYLPLPPEMAAQPAKRLD
jgi:hypothetical protein